MDFNIAKIIKNFTNSIIEDRKKETQDAEKFDLLTLFSNLTSEDGSKLFSESELSDIILNFIIAGRDTTAQALSWTFYLLAKNPSIKAELLQEVQLVLGKREKLSYEDIKDMSFARAVFLEALRLYPSVPKNLKQCIKDDYLPDGTFIPKNANVIWSPYSMGRSELIWGPDACEFKPSRWIEMVHQPSLFEYPVFHAGPRVCLGRSMAELEGIFVLVSVLAKFDYVVIDINQIKDANSLTIPMANGMKVLISNRI